MCIRDRIGTFGSIFHLSRKFRIHKWPYVLLAWYPISENFCLARTSKVVHLLKSKISNSCSENITASENIVTLNWKITKVSTWLLTCGVRRRKQTDDTSLQLLEQEGPPLWISSSLDICGSDSLLYSCCPAAFSWRGQKKEDHTQLLVNWVASAHSWVRRTF